MQARIYSLDKFIFTPYLPPPPIAQFDQMVWKRIQPSALALVFILSGDVYKVLRERGYEPSLEEDLYLLQININKVLPRLRETNFSSLIVELAIAKPSKYGSLQEYLKRILTIKSRLDRAQPDPLELQEKTYLSLVLNNLKEQYPDWYNLLDFERARGRLIQPVLMDELRRKADEEVLGLLMAVIKPTINGNGQQQQQ